MQQAHAGRTNDERDDARAALLLGWMELDVCRVRQGVVVVLRGAAAGRSCMPTHLVSKASS
jgi:hypothetical protein